MKVILQNSHRTIPVGNSTILSQGRSNLVRVNNDFSNRTFGTIIHGNGNNYSLIPRFAGSIYVNDKYVNGRVFLQHGDQIRFTCNEKTENYIFLIKDYDYSIQPETIPPATLINSPKIIAI